MEFDVELVLESKVQDVDMMLSISWFCSRYASSLSTAARHCDSIFGYVQDRTSVVVNSVFIHDGEVMKGSLSVSSKQLKSGLSCWPCVP
jgi:hypothetical protein